MTVKLNKMYIQIKFILVYIPILLWQNLEFTIYYIIKLL